MELNKCKNCGANNFKRIGDKYVCQYCGTEYPIPADELAKEKKADAKSSARSQNAPVSHSTQKSGYVNAAPTKPPKKTMSRGTRNAIIVIIVIAVLAIISILSSSDSDDTEEESRTAAVETETVKETEVTEAAETESETDVHKIEAAPVDDFDYELEGNEILLQSYEGNNDFLEITSSYTVNGNEYYTNLTDFQVRSDDVKTIVFDEGITELKTSVFNSCDVETVYFPSSMIYVYDYTLAYLHPDDGQRIQIYYAGSEEQWNNVLTEYERTKVSDATSAEEIGGSLGDAVNQFIGMEYDSSEFEYHFDASPDDLK